MRKKIVKIIYVSIILVLAALTQSNCERIKIERINKTNTSENSNQNNYVTIESEILDFAEGNNIVFGHCIGIEQLPDTSDIVSDYLGRERKKFTDTLSGLVHNELYYYRPYIKNDTEITYGETSSFTAVFAPEEVNFSSFQASVLEYNKMMFSCIPAGNGSFRVESYGYMIRNTSKQTDWLTIEHDGLNPDLYSDTVRGIIPGDVYELKAFIESAGFGKVFSETYQLSIQVLQVITGSYMLLNSTSVRLYGQIVKGSLSVTDHGFCYSYSNSNPDLNDESVSLGESTSQQFNSDISGLTPNVIYYYRAYGIEGNRITYGEIEQFIISE